MKDPIAIYRYTLVSRDGLNAKSFKTEHHGALIRLGSDHYGYGCIHPWPELGDMELEQTLQCFGDGVTSPLIDQALRCARADRDARCAGKSLFEGLVVPHSHATVSLSADAFKQAQQAGFGAVKVKVGRQMKSEVGQIRSLAQEFPEFRWRFDFNHTCRLQDVEQLLLLLGNDFLERIDFMEDAWLEDALPEGHLLGIPLAVDQQVEELCDRFPIAIVKPARNNMESILERLHGQNTKVVFTSYMDHPLGQSFAAWQAALAASKYPSMVVDACGLATHGLFEPDAFTKALGKVEPQFHPALGTGLGFDTLLTHLPWTPLI